MIEVLTFTFQSFWTFAGCVLLLVILTCGLTDICGSIFRGRK